MSAVESGAATAARPMALRAFRRGLARAWDVLFGPPKVERLPDGLVTVRLMGRRFTAGSLGGLLDSVGWERERLLEQLSRLHARAGSQPMLGSSRFIDPSHREAQRIHDRLGVYSEFIGRAARELERGRGAKSRSLAPDPSPTAAGEGSHVERRGDHPGGD